LAKLPKSEQDRTRFNYWSALIDATSVKDGKLRLQPDSGYLRAKVAQEAEIEAGAVPYTILRATQFFEFLSQIVEAGAEGDSVRLSTGLIQFVAANDVAATVAESRSARRSAAASSWEDPRRWASTPGRDASSRQPAITAE
jgi:hypothetical protein